MISIRRIRKIDFWIQSSLLPLAFSYSLLTSWLFPRSPVFLLGYFIVGLVQISSCICYWKNRKKWGWHRRAYILVVLFLLVCCATPLIVVGLFTMLLVSPLLAIWYYFILKAEYRKYRRFDMNGFA